VQAMAGAAGSVLVTTRTFGTGTADPAGLLHGSGLRVCSGDPGHRLDLLRDSLAEAVAWIAGAAPIRAEHLAAAPRLRVIARYGVGVDGVDLAAAAGRHVIVTNTPGANTAAVADFAVALMLAALRHVMEAAQAVRGGSWRDEYWRGRELGELTVGLVGFGAVGQATAARLTGFGPRLLAHDPYVPPAELRRLGVHPVADLGMLAAGCDVVSLHAPGGRVLVDERFLARLPEEAVLVNTARGDLIDEDAVAAALHGGRLGAYATDVLAAEPALTSPLLEAPHVLITPHIAAQSNRAVDRMGMGAAEEVLRVLAGEPALHPVVAPGGSREGSR
jgi:D-3-phosphoglycerate dehydrogenase / 2-oxoglutarate reductase